MVNSQSIAIDSNGVSTWTTSKLQAALYVIGRVKHTSALYFSFFYFMVYYFAQTT